VVEPEAVERPEALDGGTHESARRGKIGEVGLQVRESVALTAEVGEHTFDAFWVRAPRLGRGGGGKRVSEAPSSRISRRAIAKPIPRRRLTPVTNVVRDTDPHFHERSTGDQARASPARRSSFDDRERGEHVSDATTS